MTQNTRQGAADKGESDVEGRGGNREEARRDQSRGKCSHRFNTGRGIVWDDAGGEEGREAKGRRERPTSERQQEGTEGSTIEINQSPSFPRMQHPTQTRVGAPPSEKHAGLGGRG